MSSVTKYYGVARKRKLANMAIAILTIVAVLIVLITIYGQNVGNFVVSVESTSQLQLSLSETRDFADPKSRLAAKGLNDQTNTTYNDIPINSLYLADGSCNDEQTKRYFAYSFYIRNESSAVVNYSMEMQLNHATKGAESALRVLVHKEGGNTNIYAKPKEYPETEIGQPEDHVGTGIELNYSTLPFLSTVSIFRQTTADGLKSTAKDKYTIVMWLEGWDNECTDEIMGAIMRMEVRFKAYQA